MTLQNVFLHLLNMSITAGWLVLAVVVLRLLFRRAPKWIHCLLWVLVALRLLFPVSIESALSIIPSAETVPVETFMYDTPVINSGVPVVDNAVNPVLSDSFAPQPENSVNPMQVLTILAAYVWVLGVALMLLYAAITTLRLSLRVRESVRLRDNIYRCDRIGTPFILGIIRPRIYLPTTLSIVDTHSVVSHEMAHIQRRDHWWKPLGFLLLTVYWFNPLLWVGYVLLCRDIEAACDQRVIRDMDLIQRKSYSDTLLACSAPRHLITACPLAFGETGVKSRIKAVLNYKKPAFWLIITAVVASIVAAVCLLTNPASNDKLDSALSQIILTENKSKHSDDVYPTEAHTIFGTTKKDGKTIVYTLVLYEEYYRDGNGDLQTLNSSHIPTAITLGTNEDGAYYLEEYWIPGDGTQYLPDMKEKFPFFYRIRVDTGKYYDIHHEQTLADAMEYFSEKTFLATSARFTFSNISWKGDADFNGDGLPVTVIRSVKELNDFIALYDRQANFAMIQAFDEDYFREKAVLAVFYGDGSASVEPRVIGIDYTDGLQVQVDVYRPYIQVGAEGHWCMLVSVDQEDVDSASSITARVRGYIAADVYAAAFEQAVEEPVGARELWRDRLNDEEYSYLWGMVSRLYWGEKSMKGNSGTFIGAFNVEGITGYVSADYSFVCTNEEMAYLTAEDSDFLRKLYQPRGAVTHITPYWRDDVTNSTITKKEPTKNYWQTLSHPMHLIDAVKVTGGYTLDKGSIEKLQKILDEVTWKPGPDQDAEFLCDAYFCLDGETRYYVYMDSLAGYSYLATDQNNHAPLTEDQANQIGGVVCGGVTVKATHYLSGNYCESNKEGWYFVLDVVWADDPALVGKKIRVSYKNTLGRGAPHIGTMIEVAYDGTVVHNDMVYAIGWDEQDADALNLTGYSTETGTFTGKVIHVADGSVLINCYDKDQFDTVWVNYGNSYPELKPQMGEEYTVTHDGMVMETYPPQVTAVEMLAVSSTPLKSDFISEERAIEIAIEHWKVQIGEPDMETGYFTTVYVIEYPTEDNPRYKIGSRLVDEQDGAPGNSALHDTLDIDAVTGIIIVPVVNASDQS